LGCLLPGNAFGGVTAINPALNPGFLPMTKRGLSAMVAPQTIFACPDRSPPE
jgi:hypothetical protein